MANEVCIDGIWYVLNEETKEAMVTSSYNSRDEYRGRVIIPKVVVYVHKKYTVTSIGKNAFSCCFRLISITIPESIISIGDEAFGFCLGLISIIVSDKNTKYDSRNNCNAIIETKTNTLIAGCAKTIIPKSVTSIGDNAFYGCDGLSSITIPESVSSIGNYAFSNCPGLAIIVSDKNTKYDSRNNCNAIIETKTNTLIVGCAKTIIPKSVTSIGDNAFYHCNGLASIAIPESVISIGDAAFYRCHDLLSISFPEGVTSIGDAAFYGCHNLSSIIIPGSINTIGENVFRECFGMASVAFHPSTTETALKIGYIKDSPDKCYSPFHDSPLSTIILDRELLLTNKNGSNNNISPSLCKGIFTNIKTATLGKQVKNIMPAMFYQCPLSSITISEGVTNIGNYAFSRCNGLKSITIPKTVTNIGNYAFSGCSGLTSITIPEGITRIGNYAFSGCSRLTSITIPESTTKIGKGITCSCSDLISVIVNKKNSQYDSRNNCNAIIETKTNTLIAGCAKTVIHENVTNIGDSAFSDCRDLTSITIPEGVTSIGYGAFSGCNSLQSITIPKSVTSIGNGAFSGCRGLTSVTIPEGLTSIGYETFRGCYSLQSITIPESVTSIEGGAFSGCRALTSVTIPEGVRSIGNDAFCACDSLKSITILEGVTSIGYGAFSGCGYLKSITIPRSVTRIEDEAFKGCFSLTSITIPDSGINILRSAFDDTALYKDEPDGLVYIGKFLYKYKGRMPENTSVKIKDGTIGIISSAFEGCSGLTSITIPESVMSIGNFAFGGCSNLTSITIPESVTSIGSAAFYSCRSLISIIVSDRNTQYDSRNNCNAIIETKTNALIVGCAKTIIPKSVTSIGNAAFKGCSELTSITIPKGVTGIGNDAFYGCSGLTSITIPESVTSIGISVFNDTAWYKSIPDGLVCVGKILYKYKGRMPENTSVEIKEGTIGISSSAFSGCCGLISITIPESVTSIGNYAFSDCRALKEVCCYSFPEGLQDAFDKSLASNIVLYLPKYAIEENKDLSGFKEIIPIEAKVKIIELPETIVLTEKSVRLLTPIITPRYATDQHLKWSSSNEEAAVVNSKGRVVALSSGTATITAMATDGSEVFSSCEIVVRRMMESIQLNQTSLKLVAGNAFSLNATVTPKDAYDGSLTWSTTDDDIAMILGNGRIVAVSAGNATITAKANDGSEVAATCEVTVTEG